MFQNLRQALVAQVESDPDEVEEQFWQNLAQALTVAAHLVNKRLISTEQGETFFS